MKFSKTLGLCKKNPYLKINPLNASVDTQLYTKDYYYSEAVYLDDSLLLFPHTFFSFITNKISY